ncbi:hypothetical protein F4679DRAFT_535389 [Xylaria curta]|nr:hypothetical protein F4679DRAFT_535389 [Xylaria curta]
MLIIILAVLISMGGTTRAEYIYGHNMSISSKPPLPWGFYLASLVIESGDKCVMLWGFYENPWSSGVGSIILSTSSYASSSSLFHTWQILGDSVDAARKCVAAISPHRPCSV